MRQAARSAAHFSQKLSTCPPSSTAPLLTVTLICVRLALSSQPTSFSISCCNSVSFHMVWPSGHAVRTVVFPPECISHCSLAFYLKIRMRTGAGAAYGAVPATPTDEKGHKAPKAAKQAQQDHQGPGPASA